MKRRSKKKREEKKATAKDKKTEDPVQTGKGKSPMIENSKAAQPNRSEKAENDKPIDPGEGTHQKKTTQSPKGVNKPGPTYAEAVQAKEGPILQQFKSHRMTVTFMISLPETKAKRTKALSKGLNRFLAKAKEVAYKKRTVYIRKFADHHTPKDTDKPEWINEFEEKKASQLIHYTHGFYPTQKLRKGTFRFKVQVMLPVQDNTTTFIENVNELFGEKENWKVQDLDAQNLYDPRDVGWLFRSHWTMSSSKELCEELEKRMNKTNKRICLGMSHRLITPPGEYVYDKETAVNAALVSCNAKDYQEVYDQMMNIYGGVEKCPFGIQLKFIPLKDHPDIKTNLIALQNLSILIDRQRIFNTQVQYAISNQLADAEALIPEGSLTMRKALMILTPSTTSEEFKNAKLFLSITKRLSREGDIQFCFTFHEAFEMEARSIINNLGLFIRDEMGLDPDVYCYPSAIHPSHKWDPASRTCINPTGTLMADLVGCTLEIKDKAEEEDEPEPLDADMTSKEGREFRRMVGVDDTETVNNIQVKKKAKPKIPQQVGGEERSVRSELSGLTNYSSETKASQHRKELRSQVADQQVEIDEKDDEIKKLKEMLKAQSIKLNETKKNDMEGENTKDSDDGISYADTPEQASPERQENIEEPYDPTLFHPTGASEDTYDAHRMYLYPDDEGEITYLLEEEQVPHYHTDITDVLYVDPHWALLRKGTFKQMSFLARKKSLESMAVFVVTLEDDDEEAAVYVWEIKGQRYAVYGTSKYDRLIPPDTAHYLYRKVSRTHIRYPTVPTEEEKLVFLDEEETIPIHNPFQEVGHELDHHWVPFAEGETAQITLKAAQYRTDGYCILVSGTGATEGNLSIFLWAVGLHEAGTVGYAHREEDDDSNEEMEQQDRTQEAEGTEEGQSAGTPPAEPPKVQFHHYNHVQAFSTDDGNLIGEEEDHSMKEGSLQREQSEHSFEKEDTDRDQDGASVQSGESENQIGHLFHLVFWWNFKSLLLTLKNE